MATFKKSGTSSKIYKESPYYGGGYTETRKIDKPKDISPASSDSKNLDDNKLSKLSTHFSVLRLTRNPSKHETSSGSWSSLFDQKAVGDSDSESVNGESRVQKIVSGLERTFRSLTESKKDPLTSSVILEEEEENENALAGALETSHPTSSPGQHEIFELGTGNHVSSDSSAISKTSMYDNPPPEKLMSFQKATSDALSPPLKLSINGSDASSPSLKPINNSFEMGSQSSSVSSKGVGSHEAFIPSRSFHSTSSSLSSLPELGNLPLPPVLRKPKTIHESNEGESVGFPGDAKALENSSTLEKLGSNSLDTHRKRSLSPEDHSHKSSANPREHTKDSAQQIFHSLANGKMNPKDSHTFDDTSEPANTTQKAYAREKIMGLVNLDADEPCESQLHKADSVETLDTWASKSEDSNMNIRPKNHHTAFKRRGGHKDEKVFFSGVASAFYNGGSLGLGGVISCSSISMINEFLKERQNELRAGVPGKWLTIVLGGESSDLSTIVSTIMYAYFLNLTTKPDQLCIVPLINMTRADLNLHPDVSWLFTSCGLDTASLLFLDEISLPYYHRFGSLRLVLVNHSKLCLSQENLKDDVEEILDIHVEVDVVYPHLKTIISDEDVGSSCTIVAEAFVKHHPELLAGKAVCRLMLAAILLDTVNLTTAKTTRRDLSMATLLLNGAGRFGRNGFFKILKQKSHDLSSMNTNELLRKQFKQLNLGSSDEASEGKPQHDHRYNESVGMSSLPIPLSEVLRWEDDSAHIIAEFRRSMDLSIFVLVTGYYETSNTFKREVFLVAEDNELINKISNFIFVNNKGVKFITMLLPGLPIGMKGFTLEGKKVSRTIIQGIIQDFFLG